MRTETEIRERLTAIMNGLNTRFVTQDVTKRNKQLTTEHVLLWVLND